jgi:uroporphyrinogen decarboxylase
MSEYLTSKERVKKAINHQEPDRVPVYINADQPVVQRLKQALNITTTRELLRALHVDIFDMRGIDVRGDSSVVPKYIGPENTGIPADWSGNITELWGIKEIAVQTESGPTITQVEYPLAEANSIEELERYCWPDPDWFDYADLRERLKEWTEFAILCSGCSVFQHPTYVRGMDKLMLDMAINPEMADFVFDTFTDFYYEFYRRIFEQAGDLIDIFALADDLGMQNSLLISPRMFEKFVAPRLQKMADLAYQYDIKLLLHSDGNIQRIIPRLIELGFDVLDPIQPEAMDPLKIKKEFGEQLCLRGGISAQQTLTRGTVDDVVTETKRILKHLAPGGGYILAPGHPVLTVDMPTENIIAMYETAFKYGDYK